MFIFYSFLLTAAFLLLLPLFILRRSKYAPGFRQRLGFLPVFEHDDRPVVWIHCVSVGETNAARPLIAGLRQEFPRHRLIVSTTTKTGQELARTLFGGIADLVFYMPFDWKFTVRRDLRKFKPSVVLIMETELWFNFIRESKRAGAAVFLVNGRLSERSLKGYLRIPGKMMSRVLNHFDLVLMQGSGDAERLKQLGIAPEKVVVTGNLKFDQESVDRNTEASEMFLRRFGMEGGAPLIVAASTHSPEEEWILEAFGKAREKSGIDARLLIAPRHPERFDDVARVIASKSFRFARRSAAATPDDAEAEVILLDSIGELREVYFHSEIVFVGGSLIPHGGQSILEPAAAGNAIITGPYTMNFTESVEKFQSEEALIRVTETEKERVTERLAASFSSLLEDSARRAQLAANAAGVMEKNRGAAAATIEMLRPFFSDARVRSENAVR